MSLVDKIKRYKREHKCSLAEAKTAVLNQMDGVDAYDEGYNAATKHNERYIRALDEANATIHAIALLIGGASPDLTG